MITGRTFLKIINGENRIITESLRKLEKLNLVIEERDSFRLTPQFRLSLHNAITGG